MSAEILKSCIRNAIATELAHVGMKPLDAARCGRMARAQADIFASAFGSSWAAQDLAWAQAEASARADALNALRA